MDVGTIGGSVSRRTHSCAPVVVARGGGMSASSPHTMALSWPPSLCAPSSSAGVASVPFLPPCVG